MQNKHSLSMLSGISYTRSWHLLQNGLVKTMLYSCYLSALSIPPTYATEIHSAHSQSHQASHHNVAQQHHVITPKHRTTRIIQAKQHTPYQLPIKNNIDKRLVNFVQRMVSNLHYSSYKLGGTHFDMRRGVYIVDCSVYVDHILKEVYPHAYSKLVHWSKSKKPTTHHYYHFFNNLSIAPQRYWNPVKQVAQLQPGDILVFRKKKYAGTDGTGHIMIVMDKPVQRKNMFMLRIADSAPYRHSQDTRHRAKSGIGIGTMVVKVNPHTDQPAAYAWTVGSHWKQNVVFAMARPLPRYMAPSV